MTTSELKNRLNASLDYLKEELLKVRTGRVSSALIENVKVEAYGATLTMREVGTITTLDPQTLQVVPWDKSLLDAIMKAIINSDLQLNPTNKGDAVVVPIPSLTEDRRVEFTKVVSAKAEEAKNSMRSIRQEAMKSVDQAFEKKEFGEDEKFSRKEDIEEVLKEYVQQADATAQSKKDEILKI